MIELDQDTAAPADPTWDAVVGERRQLINIAYRLLGSIAEAEDAVQEAYARWYAMTDDARDAIAIPGAWLTKVATRICLDHLRSARARREAYVGEWIPEPLPDRSEWLRDPTGHPVVDPVDRVTLDESISMAFLVVLQSMTPAERVALILHDVFGFSFHDISGIVGRTPAACRQLAYSARRRVQSSGGRVAEREQTAVVRAFKEAWDDKDIDRLVALLDPRAVARADSGGAVRAATRPIRGARAIATHLVEDVSGRARLSLLVRRVNGQPGLVVQQDGVTVAVFAFEVDGGRVCRMWATRNPDKLRSWAQLAT